MDVPPRPSLEDPTYPEHQDADGSRLGMDTCLLAAKGCHRSLTNLLEVGGASPILGWSHLNGFGLILSGAKGNGTVVEPVLPCAPRAILGQLPTSSSMEVLCFGGCESEPKATEVFLS